MCLVLIYFYLRESSATPIRAATDARSNGMASPVGERSLPWPRGSVIARLAAEAIRLQVSERSTLERRFFLASELVARLLNGVLCQ